MSTSKEEKRFRFSLKHLFRLSLFLGVLYLLFAFFINQQNSKNSTIYDPTVLGDEISTSPSLPSINLQKTSQDLYGHLPPKSREMIENINQNPVIISIQEKYEYIRDEIGGFPQKQINEIKKTIIQNIYQDLMEGIPENE